MSLLTLLSLLVSPFWLLLSYVFFEYHSKTIFWHLNIYLKQQGRYGRDGRLSDNYRFPFVLCFYLDISIFIGCLSLVWCHCQLCSGKLFSILRITNIKCGSKLFIQNYNFQPVQSPVVNGKHGGICLTLNCSKHKVSRSIGLFAWSILLLTLSVNSGDGSSYFYMNIFVVKNQDFGSDQSYLGAIFNCYWT